MSACKPAATCNEFVRQGLLSACNHMNARARGRNITRNSCNEVVRQRLESFSTSADDASQVEQRRRRSIATLSDRLKLSGKNAEIVYDQLRCARCDTACTSCDQSAPRFTTRSAGCTTSSPAGRAQSTGVHAYMSKHAPNNNIKLVSTSYDRATPGDTMHTCSTACSFGRTIPRTSRCG